MPTLDSLINKATDPTLTSDNWEYIVDVCDKISADPETATKEAITTLKTKLTSKDANVVLRSLSLLTAIAENCGSRIKQEIATKSFLQDCLIKRLSDKKLHQTVKSKICEVITQLYNTFKVDPSLKPMTDAYNKAKRDYPQYFNKKLEGPSKPAKKERTQQDKDREEEELQRALKLSLQEYEQQSKAGKKEYPNNKPLPEPKPEPESPPVETVATVSKVRALYDLISYEPDELSFRKGDVITVIESVYRDWWRGSLANGKIGIFPLNYVTPIVNKSPQEVAKEIELENKLINGEKKKIEKLLAILSSQQIDTINEDEVTQLYNEIIPLRIQLGTAIDKYSVRKEELLGLNQSLNNEVKNYNELLDKSIASRAQQHNTGGLMYQQTAPYPMAPQQQQQQQQQHTQHGQIPQQRTQQSQQQELPPQYTQSQQQQQAQAQYSGYASSNNSMPPPPATSFNQYVPPQLQELQPQETSAGFGNAGYNRPPAGQY